MRANLLKGKKILILHDYFIYKGGGERLVISLAKGLGAEIATAFVAPDAFDPRKEGIKTRVLYRENFLSRLPGFRYLSVNWAFLTKTGFIRNYDVVIYSGDCLSALPRARGKVNIAYMHTPPRYLYDTYEDRIKNYSLLKSWGFKAFTWLNRQRFDYLVRKLNLIITNSQNTRRRIKDYLGLDAAVVYPPGNTLNFKNLGYGDYFFSWARLFPEKRVDRIVAAFQKLPDKKLVVASGGLELSKIKKMAQGYPNIQVLGYISDAGLVRQLGSCLASIYVPLREDFGMAAVESMAAGKPVIGVAEGGLLEIIEDGKNGILLKSDFTPEDLVKAVKSLTKDQAQKMEKACYQTAKRFTEEEFWQGMRRQISQLLAKETRIKSLK
ncbi:MAG: glycosyltransferase [Patescibacteria group bacterium]